MRFQYGVERLTGCSAAASLAIVVVVAAAEPLRAVRARRRFSETTGGWPITWMAGQLSADQAF